MASPIMWLDKQSGDMPHMTGTLIRKNATQIVDLLKAGKVSPLELLDALEARIAEVDGQVNALPTLCFERARKHAKNLMKLPMYHNSLRMI